jgi:hypothetical protein
VLLLLVSTLFGTTQEVVVGQFGPVTTICAFEVLKLLPLIVSEKVPAVTVVGEMLLIEGAGGLTVSVAPFDRVVPEPFCTWIVKLPGVFNVNGPTNLVLLLLVSTLFGTTQEVLVGQFGPVTTICAFEVLKLLPLIVSERVPAVTVVGEILLIDGVLLTVRLAALDKVVPEPFCT